MDNKSFIEKVKICGGNIKLGNMGTFSKLFGNDTFTSRNLSCSGTCGNYCKGCKNACYVKSSYRYSSVVYRHILNTLAFREDIVKAFDRLDSQLTRKKKPFTTVRINQSGELESALEYALWCDLAKKHPNTRFYIYTKAYDLINPSVAPKNMITLISVWGTYGIDTYKKWEHLDNVKAFVLVNSEFTFEYYKALGLEIQTSCKAYDEKGHLDHNITCDKCRKCFNNNKCHKVVCCFEH